MSCACLRAKVFPLLLLLVLYYVPDIAAEGTIFNVSSMTQCGPDSNPTPHRRKADTLPYTLITRVNYYYLTCYQRVLYPPNLYCHLGNPPHTAGTCPAGHGKRDKKMKLT